MNTKSENKIIDAQELKTILNHMNLLRIRGMVRRPGMITNKPLEPPDLSSDIFTIEEVIEILQKEPQKYQEDLISKMIEIEEENRKLKEELAALKVAVLACALKI